MTVESTHYLKLYLIFFSSILWFYYLIPSGTAYLFFYYFKKEKWNNRHIQRSYPTKKSIYREIRWSLISITVLSLLTLILYWFVHNDHTKMYFSVGEMGLAYLIISSIIIIVIYDTYYYWIHRFMHLKYIFPWIHKIHHLSHAPSPWATLAFNPAETILEFSIYPIMIFMIPLHPIAIGIFIIYNIILNTGGHLGYEIVPQKLHSSKLSRFSLTVTHHDMHHSKTNCNYGIYFNIWDKIMGTNHKDYESNLNRIYKQINNK